MDDRIHFPCPKLMEVTVWPNGASPRHVPFMARHVVIGGPRCFFGDIAKRICAVVLSIPTTQTWRTAFHAGPDGTPDMSLDVAGTSCLDFSPYGARLGSCGPKAFGILGLDSCSQTSAAKSRRTLRFSSVSSTDSDSLPCGLVHSHTIVG